MSGEPMDEIPPQVQEILDAIHQGSAIVCYAKCHACMFQQHPGGWHTWADDPSDWERAVYLLGPDPREQKCGCPCADGPALEPDPEPDFESFDLEPCPVCGAAGACSYDTEGRPLIHTDTTLPEDEDEA